MCYPLKIKTIIIIIIIIIISIVYLAALLSSSGQHDIALFVVDDVESMPK